MATKPGGAPDPIEAALAGQREAVIDASLATDFVVGQGERHQRARRFFLACDRLKVSRVAPFMFAFELDTALRQVVLRKAFPVAKLPAAYHAVDLLPVTLICDAGELDAARKRARAIAELLQQPSVYDATYAALAEARGCHFWTADKTFANAARQARRLPNGTTAPALPVVRFIGDY